MPKKRQSQPVQVWLATADLVRLQHAAKKIGRTQSAIARDAIVRALDELQIVLSKIEKDEREKELQKQLFDRFSNESIKLLSLARDEAEMTQAQLVGSEHLLLALAVETGRTGNLLSKFGLTHSLVRARTKSGWPSIYSVVATPPYSPTLVRILDRARLIAKQSHDKWVQPEHLLLSLLEQGNGFAFGILELAGLPRDEVRDVIRQQLPKLRKERLWKRKG
jgi:ATP-dependent Clp protease ATP-binding subunit ClpC